MSSKRFQARRRSGRFTRNTMENTFGLHVVVCEVCRHLNPWNVGEAAPTKCHHCGASLEEKATRFERCPRCQSDDTRANPGPFDAPNEIRYECNSCSNLWYVNRS
jgi:hypothetical protein